MITYGTARGVLLPSDGASKHDTIRNEDLATIAPFQEIRKYLAGLVARRRIALFNHACRQSDFTPATGATSSVFGIFKTSRSVTTVRCRMVVLPANTTLTTELPRMQWTVTPYPVTGGTALTQDYINCPFRLVAAEAPDNHYVIDQLWDDLTPDTWYSAELSLEDYARIISVQIYEETDINARYERERPKRGVGDSLAISGANVTLTDAGASFDADDVGRYITIFGATSRGNNGTFAITAQTATTVTYVNDDGATESFTNGQWVIMDKVANPRRYMVGAPITASDVAHLADLSKALYKRQGGPFGCFSVIDQANAFQQTGSGYVNVFDGSAGGGSTANVPGFWAWTLGTGDIATGTVHCVFWTYATQATAAGTIRLWDTANTTAYGATTLNVGGPSLYLTEIDLPATSADSPLFLALEVDPNGGTSDIIASGFFQWEA